MLGGARSLTGADLVVFPAGPAATHVGGSQVATPSPPETHRKPWMSAYPDSDKVKRTEGILLRSSAVDYWYGEGTGAPAEPREFRATRRPLQPPPVVNVDSLEAAGIPLGLDPPAGFRGTRGADRRTARAGDVGSHAAPARPRGEHRPLSLRDGREDVADLSHPNASPSRGRGRARGGDVVCFVEGPTAHTWYSTKPRSTTRVLYLRPRAIRGTVHFPDSGKLLVREGNGRWHVFRESDQVGDRDGKTGPNADSSSRPGRRRPRTVFAGVSAPTVRIEASTSTVASAGASARTRSASSSAASSAAPISR